MSIRPYDIEAWLASEPVRRASDIDIVTGFAERLATLAPVGRMALSVRTMHPEVYVRNLQWQQGKGTKLVIRSHDILDTAMYRDSPVALIHAGTDQIRARLDGPEPSRYAVCNQLRDEGAVDYIVYRLPLYDSVNSFISFVTWDEAGFKDEHLALFEKLLPVLSLRVALLSVLNAARSLLRTYLGLAASKHVLRGDFRRGTGHLIDAVIWTCDMRGFTAMVDRHPIDAVITTLDSYFEAVAGPINEHGGEILKLIGDAVLAVFPTKHSHDKDHTNAGADASAEADAHAGADGHNSPAKCDAPDRALKAAKQALQNVRALKNPGGGPVEIGIGLHVGEVLYGNIGASDRLDFTVIGRAVNEVCRVEAQCKQLRVPLLLTQAFVERLDHPEVTSLGHHTLRGVSGETALFTLAALAAHRDS